MKVLYLIASHTNPEQLIRLVKTIKQGSSEAQVVIHHDHSKSEIDCTAFIALPGVHLLEDYIPVKWGEFSMVEMELYCINWLIDRSFKFEWLVFLSGQDYPIQPLQHIESFLKETEYDGFMEHFPIADPPENPPEYALHWSKLTGVGRFFYHYHYKMTLPRLIKSVLYRLAQVINGRQPFIHLLSEPKRANKIGRVCLGIRCFKTPFDSEFKCYAGSQWFTLSYECICYIHEFVRKNPEFIEHYRHTFIPDESFFQTILVNQPRFRIFNNSKRYLLWDIHSTVSTLESHFLEKAIQSKQHFARKFNQEIDANALDLLDQHLNKQASCSQTSIN